MGFPDPLRPRFDPQETHGAAISYPRRSPWDRLGKERSGLDARSTTKCFGGSNVGCRRAPAPRSVTAAGVVRARLGNHTAATDDYTFVVDAEDVEDDLRAMALYNRALTFHAAGKEREATDDLNQLLALPGATSRVKTEARRRLVRMERNTTRTGVEGTSDGFTTQGGSDAGVKSETE